MTKHILAYVQYRLTKFVPNDTFDFAFQFNIHLYKLAHLHIHEF